MGSSTPLAMPDKLGDFDVLLEIISFSSAAQTGRNQVHEYVVRDISQGYNRTARLVPRFSGPWMTSEATHLRVVEAIRPTEISENVIVPIQQFVWSGDEQYMCFIYDDVLGPDWDWMTYENGPVDNSWPPSMIRRLTRHVLTALQALETTGIGCGLTKSSLRVVYSNLRTSTQDEIRQFFNMKEGDTLPRMNDTLTGPRDMPCTPSNVQFKLTALQDLQRLNQIDLQYRNVWSPEHLLLGELTSATAMFCLGSVLTDLGAAQSATLPVFTGSVGNSLEVLWNSQEYLGPLPEVFKHMLREKLESAHIKDLVEIDEDNFQEEALLERLCENLKSRVNHHWTGERLNEDELHLLADLLHKMMMYEPSKRIRPEQALQHPFLAEPSS